MKRSNDQNDNNKRPLKTKVFTGDRLEEAAKSAVYKCMFFFFLILSYCLLIFLAQEEELSDKPIVLRGTNTDCDGGQLMIDIAYWPPSVVMAKLILNQLDKLDDKISIPLGNALIAIANGKLTETSKGEYDDERPRKLLRKHFKVTKIEELGIFACIDDIDEDDEESKIGYHISYDKLSPFLYTHIIEMCDEGFC